MVISLVLNFYDCPIFNFQSYRFIFLFKLKPQSFFFYSFQPYGSFRFNFSIKFFPQFPINYLWSISFEIHLIITTTRLESFTDFTLIQQHIPDNIANSITINFIIVFAIKLIQTTTK